LICINISNTSLSIAAVDAQSTWRIDCNLSSQLKHKSRLTDWLVIQHERAFNRIGYLVVVHCARD
jgi:hypothetical protein